MQSVLRAILLSIAVLWVSLVTAGAGEWQTIETAVSKEPAECVSWSEGRIDCFARSFGGSLSWITFDNGAWSAPKNLGGTLSAVPSCVVRGPGGINCFAPTSRGVLATIYLNGNNWSKWESLGGTLIPSRASCVSTAKDRIVCFSRDVQGQLVERVWNGGRTWEPWRNRGGLLTADPECLVVGASSAACFGRGADGALVAFLPDATGKSGGWTTLGGRIEGKPSCLRLKSGDVSCVAIGRNRNLQTWHGVALFAQENGTFGSINAVATSEPSCALKGDEMTCAWRDQAQQLVRKTFSSNAAPAPEQISGAPLVAAVSCLAFQTNAVGCVVADNKKALRFSDFGSAKPIETPTEVVAKRGDKSDAKIEAKLDAPPINNKLEFDGIWFLTNLASGAQCRVALSAKPDVTKNELNVSSKCRSIGVPASLAYWRQDSGGVHFLGHDRKARLHFSSAGEGRWISPKRESAFLLARQSVDSKQKPIQTPASFSGKDQNGAPPMAGAWRVLDDQAKAVCTIELSRKRTSGGYAIERDPACAGRYDNAQYWNESGAGLVLVGSGHVVVARFVAAGQDRWRAQSASGISLVR